MDETYIELRNRLRVQWSEIIRVGLGLIAMERGDANFSGPLNKTRKLISKAIAARTMMGQAFEQLELLISELDLSPAEEKLIIEHVSKQSSPSPEPPSTPLNERGNASKPEEGPTTPMAGPSSDTFTEAVQ